MEKINLIVEEETEKLRLDLYIANSLGSKSRTFIQKLIKSGDIVVNGKKEKPSYTIAENDLINITIQDVEEINIIAENIPIEIVYEDDDLIVINKQKGMVVHPAPGNYSGTLVNALMYHFKNNLSTINGTNRPGIVHRIDKDTTGLLVVAKNDYSHQKLSEQFKEHSITREYHMIAIGNVKNEKFTVDKPIARCKKDRLKMSIDENGRRAVTHFSVIKNFNNYTYMKATLETGRTHQIRVHCAYLKHFLLGDETYYGGKFKIKTIGQTLHAKKLGFIHPTKNEYIEFDSKLPDYFEKILSNLENAE